MYPRQDPDKRLLDLAVAQAGVLSREQAEQLGVGRHSIARLASSGRWDRMTRSIYFTGPGEPAWLGWAWAGVLLGGSDARLASLAAARVHGLSEDEPWPIPVLVPDAAPASKRPPWDFRRERPGVREARSPGSPPSTTVEDTVLDLTEEGGAREAIGWVTMAVQSRRTTVPRLRLALRRRNRLGHRQLLTELLVDVAQGAETPIEVAFLRDVERAHGLPRANRQAVSRRSPDIRDVYYDAYATVVELDGRLGHEGMGRFRDMRRDNMAALSGEVPLRYGSVDVYGEPCPIAFQLGEVLVRRGWGGLPHRCPNCLSVPLELLG
ncbi:type IV toxin-antitoxin system AbiEi family antitoxin domain-containing protein [uncultured Friedmanniella sp.]|uniref:type IV toxin-antitoxin system AbiEi family antitoxin domain-containing protein n=1 Tax=uncultured Friedmanniella sp. TaxID=335381 RepID=UPI0035CAB7EA